MNSAEIKIELFRLIGSQEESVLLDLYKIVIERLQFKNSQKPLTDLANGYKAMANDTKREREAMDWIEGTANFQEI
ncbi:MAG TPA: hypothetical protein ENJ95_23800 [Bacteroidetes bacterium]|nr:hypothetical protein [Bacteroidota bacterium]